MAYTPNALDATQPTEDKFVESAAAEFRELKGQVWEAIDDLQQAVADLGDPNQIIATAHADLFDGDGVTTTFLLTATPGKEANLDVSISGVTQRPGIDYSWLLGRDIVFDVPPVVGVKNVLARYMQAIPQVSDLNLGNTTDPLKGDAMIGVRQMLDGAVGKTQHDKNFDIISVLDFIPPEQYEAIRAGTSQFDCTIAFNKALKAAACVHVPAGSYLITGPINMTNRGDTSGTAQYQGRHLIGDGSGTTFIYAYTGIYSMVDCTGSTGCQIQGFNFRSDNPGVFGLTQAACASVGITLQRGANSIHCHKPSVVDVYVQMESDMTRNGGIGTIGLFIIGAEHTHSSRTHFTANLPFFASSNPGDAPGVAASSSIPDIGSEYEPPLAGTISCGVHEHGSMMLVPIDSFRAMRLRQVGNIEFASLYTGMMKRKSTPPAYAESFYIDTCSNIRIRAIQEVSGLFGSVYRMDHRYFTFLGPVDGLDVKIRRQEFDLGFVLPGAPVPSIHFLDGTTLVNSNIDANLIPPATGLAATSTTIGGGGILLQNSQLVLNHSSAGGGATLGAADDKCVNVTVVNHATGKTQRFDKPDVSLPSNVFNPVMVGTGVAGVGTYSHQVGRFERVGQWCHFSISIAWTAHTATGDMTIRGLPYPPDPAIGFAFGIEYDGLIIGAGKQLGALLVYDEPPRIYLRANDPAGGPPAFIPIDAAVIGLVISGSYKIAPGY